MDMEPSLKRDNNSIDQTTYLALCRTRLANERTLMSWIRTSFSMIGFGFTILKFFQYLYQTQPQKWQASGSRHIGIFLILLGIFCLVPGIIEHRRQLLLLNSIDKTSPKWSYVLIIAILVGFIGCYALVRSFANH